jgi:hypothetical protein
LGDAIRDVPAYRSATPATRSPSRLSGRRHHMYVPAPTQVATSTPRTIPIQSASTAIGLRATNQMVAVDATAPASNRATAA